MNAFGAAVGERWDFVGDRFHEKVIGIFADLYEYNQYARICVWARTHTHAKVRIAKYEVRSNPGAKIKTAHAACPKNFKEKRKMVEEFFEKLIGKTISFQRLEKNAIHQNSDEATWFYCIRHLPSEFLLTPKMIAKMPASKPSFRWY